MEESREPGLNPPGQRTDLFGEVDGDRLTLQRRARNDGDQPGLAIAARIVGERPDRRTVDGRNRGRNDQIALGVGKVCHGGDLHVHHGRILRRVGHLEHELTVDQHVDVALTVQPSEPPRRQMPSVLQQRTQPLLGHDGRSNVQDVRGLIGHSGHSRSPGEAGTRLAVQVSGRKLPATDHEQQVLRRPGERRTGAVAPVQVIGLQPDALEIDAEVLLVSRVDAAEHEAQSVLTR